MNSNQDTNTNTPQSVKNHCRAGWSRVDNGSAGSDGSGDFYCELLEHANDAVLIQDLNGNLLSANRSAERVTGFSRDELARLNIAQLLASESVEPARRLVSQLVEGKRPAPLDVQLLSKSGHRVSVEVAAHLIEREGKPAAVLGVARDASNRKRIEEQLVQRCKMEAVGQLAVGVAHDFNNLLTAILGYSQLALCMLDEDSPLRLSIEEIAKSGARAADLTRQLLVFSRKQPLNRTILDLNSVIADCSKMLRRVISEDIELVIELDPALATINADRTQIEQVLVNLAVNARDAMAAGGKLIIETRNVELDGQAGVEPGRYVQLTVSDTGCGMDADTKSHAFEPFFTTKPEGKGTGLGLSTVYGIAKQSGGGVRVYSEPGLGTTFKVFFPAVNDQVPTRPGCELAEMTNGSGTVLVVEDDEVLRRLICDVLGGAGYSVLSAACGADALAVCQQHEGEIHLLVTDMVMPGMSGRELAALIAERHPEINVLYMSGYADRAGVETGLREPGENFLEKPFTPAALVRRAREAIGKEDWDQRR